MTNAGSLRSLRPYLVLPLLALLAAPLWAAGGATSSAPPSAAPEDPLVVATRHYNAGLRARNKAWKLEEKGAADDKTAKKVAKAWASAERDQRQAVELNPRMHQAWSELGYVLRRQGDYEQALQAYDRALALEASYAPAIEYRAVAYLGLGRLEDAKQAYMVLFQNDRELADQLLGEMKAWLEKGEASAEIDAAALEAFGQWVAEREQIAGHLPGAEEQQARLWR